MLWMGDVTLTADRPDSTQVRHRRNVGVQARIADWLVRAASVTVFPDEWHYCTREGLSGVWHM